MLILFYESSRSQKGAGEISLRTIREFAQLMEKMTR